MLDDMPKAEALPLSPSPATHRGRRSPASQDAASVARGRGARGKIVKPKRARRAAPNDRYFDCARAFGLCARLARHHLLSQLLPPSRPHRTGACRQERVRHLLRRKPAARRRRSRHQDVDGRLHKVVASKSEADKFVNDTILMLDDERARIKQAAHEDLDRGFALAFQDREQAISDYADWYLRVEALLCRAEGDRSSRPSPASSRPANTSRSTRRSRPTSRTTSCATTRSRC